MMMSRCYKVVGNHRIVLLSAIKQAIAQKTASKTQTTKLLSNTERTGTKEAIPTDTVFSECVFSAVRLFWFSRKLKIIKKIAILRI